MGTEQRLQQAVQAIRAGDKELGRRLLAAVLRDDPHNARAWLWLSSAVDSAEQQRDCLVRVLTIDPRNQSAHTRLARLHAGGSSLPSQSAPSAFPPATPSPLHPTAPVLARAEQAAAGPLSAPQDTDLEDARRDGGFVALQEARRRAAYRNVMLAGALTLTLICGLAMLFVTITTIVPRAQERLRPTPEPVLYGATLWCPPCEQAATPIIIWEKVGDGVTRGGKVGELPHGTHVDVVEERWSAAENRTYYRVAAEGQMGWVPQTFIKR
jgi:hypothetical protein